MRYSGTDRYSVEHSFPRHFREDAPLDLLPTQTPVRWSADHRQQRYSPEAFEDLLRSRLPSEVRAAFDWVVRASKALSREGLADEPLADERGWSRQLVICWYHATDVATVCSVLGHPRNVVGTHDLVEYLPAARLYPTTDGMDPWYQSYVGSLGPAELVNIGFMNPAFCASLCRWGDVKTGTQNAMDAHRLSSHHNGHPEAPLEWVEKAVNFVFHHLPREHYGIRHEPLGSWDLLEERLATDPAIKDDEIGKAIARDAAGAMQALESEGYITPWHLLDVPEDEVPPAASVEHAVAVVSGLISAADQQARRARVAEADGNADAARWLDEANQRDGERSASVLRELIEAHEQGAGTTETVAKAVLLSSGVSGLRAGEAPGAAWRQAAAAASALGADGFPDVDIPHLEHCMRLVERLDVAEAQARSSKRPELADRYRAWHRAWQGPSPTSDDELDVARIAELLRAAPQTRAIEGFDADEAARIIVRELEGARLEDRLVLRHLRGGGATAIKTTDIIEIAKSTTAANGLMLAARAFELLSPAMSITGWTIQAAMVIAGFRTRAVVLSRKQLLVLDVLRKQKRRRMSAGEVVVGLETGEGKDEDWPEQVVESVLESLTQVRAPSGDKKALVARNDDGTWVGLDV